MAGKLNPAHWPRRSRLLRYAALLIAVSSLTAACGHAVLVSNGADARAAAHRVTTKAQAVPASERRVAVVSPSFISPSQGWLLVVPPCALAAKPCRTLLLRRTTDGGRTWAD